MLTSVSLMHNLQPISLLNTTLHKFTRKQPLIENLLTFQQPLLPSLERLSTMCCCGGQ